MPKGLLLSHSTFLATLLLVFVAFYAKEYSFTAMKKITDSKTRQELVIIVHEGLIVCEYGHLAGPPNSFKKNSSPSAFPKKMIRFLLSEQQMK